MNEILTWIKVGAFVLVLLGLMFLAVGIPVFLINRKQSAFFNRLADEFGLPEKKIPRPGPVLRYPSVSGKYKGHDLNVESTVYYRALVNVPGLDLSSRQRQLTTVIRVKSIRRPYQQFRLSNIQPVRASSIDQLQASDFYAHFRITGDWKAVQPELPLSLCRNCLQFALNYGGQAATVWLDRDGYLLMLLVQPLNTEKRYRQVKDALDILLELAH